MLCGSRLFVCVWTTGPLPRALIEQGVQRSRIPMTQESIQLFQVSPPIRLQDAMREDEESLFFAFIESILQIAPGDRPTAEDLLGHDWVVENIGCDSQACDESGTAEDDNDDLDAYLSEIQLYNTYLNGSGTPSTDS